MIDPSIIRAMVNAGATAEVIAAAVEADYALDEEKKAEKRAKDADRQWRRRHGMSRDVTRTSCDSNGQGVTKERSPRPPKENKPPKVPTEPISPTEDAEFEEFWAAYPRRVAKPKARKAYRNARKRVEAGVILAGAKRYSAKMAGKEAEFIAHPSSWLNADRWDDEDLAVTSYRPRGGPIRTFREQLAEKQQQDAAE